MTTPPTHETAFNLAQLWAQGDWVARFVAILLLAMSVASWMVILLKSWELWRYRQQARRSEQFWHCTSMDEGIALLAGNNKSFNPFLTQAKRCQATQEHHHTSQQGELHCQLDFGDWLNLCLRGSLDETRSHMQSGLAVLASVGSTAPFVGLFGTVWGIYHALMGLSAGGVATIDRVAGPIGESLVMTALGLAVAIPAVLGYNALVRGNKQIDARLSRFTQDLHAWLITGAPVDKADKGIAHGKCPVR